MKNYWEHRYRWGRDSGEGSGGIHREWKWSKIISIIHDVDDVIDIGCGDLRFWEGRSCRSYIGLDLSPTILKRNIVARPGWAFVLGNAAKRYWFRGNVVLCMDMLFHIMDDDDFDSILSNLMSYTEQWLVIYTWDVNPLETKDDGKYMCYRKLPLERFSDFDLIVHEIEPTNEFGAIYIFKKKEKSG